MVATAGSIDEVRSRVRAARNSGASVGFVPTMGALHRGHAALIEAARKETGFVVVSIFVNPTQFGPGEDYERYPRTLEADLRCCQGAGADLVFTPTAETLYPRGGQAATFVEVPELSQTLEGAIRPGHFRGVATVVLKLLNVVGPDLAFFGQKDFQQQLLIRRMVADLDLPACVRTVPTVREPDGLALSSRNRYLDPEQRSAARVLWRALQTARERVRAGERDAERVRQILRETIELERMARLDYAEVSDPDSLAPLTELGPRRGAIGLLAVRIGTTRLIDNEFLTE